MGKTITISSNKLLIVEGSHEEKFFIKLLEQAQLSSIQVLGIGGKTFLENSLNDLRSDPSFPRVESIRIARDADNDFISALIVLNQVWKIHLFRFHWLL
jgi:hypothetical protein